MSDREILPTEAVIIHDELLNELIEIFHARGFNHRMPEDAVVRKRDQRTYHALRELRRTRGLQRLRIAPEPSVEQRKPDGYAFRYPDGFIRFSGGTRYNGDEPTETIPYYFGSPAPEPGEKPVFSDMETALMQQSTVRLAALQRLEHMRRQIFEKCWPANWLNSDEFDLRERLSAIYGLVSPDLEPPTKGAELRDCICSDPENCREPVPGRRCKAGLSVNGGA